MMNTKNATPESIHRRMRVLVVEDEPRLRDILVQSIPDMDFNVAAVKRGGEALEVFHGDPPDIVLLDLHLPDIDGMDLFERIHQSHPNTQFIILTGFGTVQAAQKAIRLDVVDFLTKPASLREIDVALDRARRRRMGQLELPDDAPAPCDKDGEGIVRLRDIERTTILETLKLFDGNRSRTAKELGISLRTLYYRLAEYHKAGFEIDRR